MAILGNLRQKTACCFAAAPAIEMHETQPVQVAFEMQLLLENNSLPMGDPPRNIPLNDSISHADADILLTVRRDGTCTGLVGSLLPSKPFKLHEMPRLDAALTELGISNKEVALKSALASVPEHGQTNMTCRDLIIYLARHTPGIQDPDKRIAAALNVFTNKTELRLLHAWVYTLATYAEQSSHFHRHVEKMAQGVLYGEPKQGEPNLPSLSKVLKAHQQALTLSSNDSDRLCQSLLKHAETTMNACFELRFDASVKTAGLLTTSGNGGGFVLYAQTSSDDPLQWEPINEKNYQTAMQVMIKKAAGISRQELANVQPASKKQAEQHALESLEKHLLNHIQTPAFIQQATIQGADKRPAKLMDLASAVSFPWLQRRGSDHTGLLAHYGSTQAVNVTIDATQGRGEAALIHFLCDGMRHFSTQIKEKSARSTKVKVQITNNGHAFTVDANEWAIIWQDGKSNADWIKSTLFAQSKEYFNAPRSTPSLWDLVQAFGQEVGADYDQSEALFEEIASLRGGAGQENPLYSLNNAKHILLRDYPGNEAALSDVLSRMAPMPLQHLGDTSFVDGEGGGKKMASSYNLLTKKIDILSKGQSDDNRQKEKASWLHGQWAIYEPIKDRAAAPAA